MENDSIMIGASTKTQVLDALDHYSLSGPPHERIKYLVDFWEKHGSLSTPSNVNVVYNGPAAFHNMPCCVNLRNHAVLDMNAGVFHPSWEAQAAGWRLVKSTSRFQRFLLKHFFPSSL